MSLDYFGQDKVLTEYLINYLDQVASLGIDQGKAGFMTSTQPKIQVRHLARA